MSASRSMSTSSKPSNPFGLSMDPYVEWSPISTREKLSWPGDREVAFGVILSLESMDWSPPAGAVHAPKLLGRGYPAVPDAPRLTQYEYGNRVGIYRVLDVLRRHGITAMVAADVMTLKNRPALLEHLQEASVEFIGHGLTSDRMISSAMTASEEAAYLDSCLAEMRALTGRDVRGWMGVEYSESERTLELLAERGVEYVFDWPIDEQPQHFRVSDSQVITNLPVAIELDDAVTQMWLLENDMPERRRMMPVERYSQMIVEQFDRLVEDGRAGGRLLLLPVHPWIIGQPFRIKYFEEAIAHIAASPSAWCATGSEISAAFEESRTVRG